MGTKAATLAAIGLAAALVACRGNVAPTALRPEAATASPTAPATSVPASSTTAPEVVEAPPVSGGRPPQFVVVSFDGAGSVELWQHWRDVARRDNAHFTFFASGVYFLTADHGVRYQPPDRPAGTSAIHFLPVPRGQMPQEYEAALLAQMSAGHAEGNEIGTHFNGHFCGINGVSRWTQGQWASELDSFFSLLADAPANNGLAATPLSFGASDIVGARTPCLEGNKALLYPVLIAHHFRYDASQTGAEFAWPVRQAGLWSFPLATIPLAGAHRSLLSMDYNLYYTQTHAHDAPSSSEPGIEEQAYRTLRDYVDQSYAGDRAPVSIGAHFTNWNHGAYQAAITRLVDDECRRPQVRCVSYAELAQWLDARAGAVSSADGVPDGRRYASGRL